MVQCMKCRLFLAKKESVARCKECSAVYHKKCAKGNVVNELCNSCQQTKMEENEDTDEANSISETSTIKIREEVASQSAKQILSELNKKLQIIHGMKKRLDDLFETVDFYAEQYQKLTENQEKSEKKFKALEQRNIYLEKCNKALEERINDLEAGSKEKNIEIVGVERCDGEDLINIASSIARKLNQDPASIHEVKRLGKERKDKEKSRPQPIIVSLTTRNARDNWLSQRKTRLTNSDIYGDNNNTPIYINEDLTKATRQLLWEAKNELKSYYKYIWIQNGRVLVRKEGTNNKIHAIRTNEDISRLKREAE